VCDFSILSQWVKIRSNYKQHESKTHFRRCDTICPLCPMLSAWKWSSRVFATITKVQN